ncbi:biopolymer transporter ExbD [Rhodocytophaga rosea]|uniref:Biopolymer transporter ExbD n=1 Tax=Rhodocytophaga rosea TaxID=2704465 RepID=A0A6C0GUL8_9BACT|nr:biopolymer transporter ExbD [Rhodocytophaga rosea]QHT71557.1 biopolymer transporter ExbD [Rhodocytophaga rosea]
MAKSTNRATPEINASSMADIAFLLLIFFLVTTTIGADKGLQMLLPPEKTINNRPSDVHDRNVLKVIINSKNELLVEDMPMNINTLRKEAKRFLANNGADPTLSDNPQIAVVSVKTDRGTEYNTYLKVLDELMAAYNELRAEKLGITVDHYLQLDEKNPKENQMLKYVQKVYPRRLSEAEATQIEM